MLNARHAGGLSLPDAPLHGASGTLAAKDDREAATHSLAAFSAHEVEGLVVEFNSHELILIFVLNIILERCWKDIGTSHDCKGAIRTLREDVEMWSFVDAVHKSLKALLNLIVGLGPVIWDE